MAILEQCLHQVRGYEASAAGYTVLWHLGWLCVGGGRVQCNGRVYTVAVVEDCSRVEHLQLLYC